MLIAAALVVLAIFFTVVLFGCLAGAAVGRWAAVGDGAALLHDVWKSGDVVHEHAALLHRPGRFERERESCCGGCSGGRGGECVECPDRESGAVAGRDAGRSMSAGRIRFWRPSGLIFPADVQSSNYAAMQIAVIYDSDGSVTDLLLGNGASDPTSCLQNGVTESVDSIVPAGYIEHAVLVLNGRCTGAAPEQQMQLQYQLMRAFGRVLGLGWSQTNDNVFTGSPQPTYNQAMHWPVMHPIDILCGPYTYQCMPQPFTLRPDDLACAGDAVLHRSGGSAGRARRTVAECESALWHGGVPGRAGDAGRECADSPVGAVHGCFSN